uniref:Medium-chain acyl-CoA ligase ACSF2, mitochondrial n=1 Tax=Timema tahoe TaxID=61484 RepID=A0A7R9FMC0_9NEOP|nr:unnamed protein product [Timema tahoe]
MCVCERERDREGRITAPPPPPPPPPKKKELSNAGIDMHFSYYVHGKGLPTARSTWQQCNASVSPVVDLATVSVSPVMFLQAATPCPLLLSRPHGERVRHTDYPEQTVLVFPCPTRCTVVYGTPTMYVDMLSIAEQKGVHVSTLDAAVIGGAPCSMLRLIPALGVHISLFEKHRLGSCDNRSSEVIRSLAQVTFVCPMLCLLGMTETGPVEFHPLLEDSKETRINTVGFITDHLEVSRLTSATNVRIVASCVIDHLEVKVVDTEGKVVPMETPGEDGTDGDPQVNTEIHCLVVVPGEGGTDGDPQVKVVDTEGKVVPMETPGELMVRGYNVMLGYWGDEEKTAEVMGADRWFRTGVVVYLISWLTGRQTDSLKLLNTGHVADAITPSLCSDQIVLLEGGYAKVVGRLKEMIIRGGENIFPKEIEDLLQSHPDILEAQACTLTCLRVPLRSRQTYHCFEQLLSIL